MMYGLTMTLKNEIVKLAPMGRVNCIGPGWVKTVFQSLYFQHIPGLTRVIPADGNRVAEEPAHAIRGACNVRTRSSAMNERDI